jgi:hypothetical protein
MLYMFISANDQGFALWPRMNLRIIRVFGGHSAMPMLCASLVRDVPRIKPSAVHNSLRRPSHNYR